MKVRRPEPGDLHEVLALCRASDIAVFGDSDWVEADLRRDWDEELDLEHNAWLVELDGRVAGYGTLEEREGGRLFGDGYVHPELRGRSVGGRLLGLIEDRARELLSSKAEPPYELQSACLYGDERAAELFAARGYRLVRHFYRMVADLDEPAEPSWPEGIEGRPLGEEDARAVHAAIQEAFVDEFDFRPEPLEEWSERRLRSPHARPDLWHVAFDGEEVAGAIACDWKRQGDWGWIAAVAVRPRWRRRGIGEALLQAAFRRFWELGERQVALGVDAENPTGATRLYERVGMRVFWRADVYRKDLSAA